MPRVVFMAMVGTRDVQVRTPDRLKQLGLNLNYREKLTTGWVLASSRSDGELLWNAYRRNNAIATFIDLPILRACLDYIRNLNLTNELSVILFYTDQNPKNVSPQHYANDTVYFAHIAEKWLSDYLERNGMRVNVQRVVISRRYSPVDSGKMLRFFDQQLPELCQPDSVDWVFISQTGGIPTVYEALLLQSIHHFRDKCIPLYVLPDGAVFPVDFREFLLEAFYREQARGLLEQHFYASAANSLERLNLTFAAALCRHAAYRLLFDFRRAKDVLDEIANDPSLGLEEKNLIESFREDMKNLQQDLPKPKGQNDSDTWRQRKEQIRSCLRELYWGFEIAVQQGAWLEVLGRLIRLAEGVLQLAVEETFKRPAGTLDEILKLAKEHSRELYHQLLNFPSKTNLNLLRGIAKRLQEEHPTWLKPAEEFSEAISLDNGLVQLRNKSILWHGFRGISKEQLERELGKTIHEALQDCREVLEKMEVKLDESPYELIRRYALDALSQ